MTVAQLQIVVGDLKKEVASLEATSTKDYGNTLNDDLLPDPECLEVELILADISEIVY